MNFTVIAMTNDYQLDCLISCPDEWIPTGNYDRSKLKPLLLMYFVICTHFTCKNYSKLQNKNKFHKPEFFSWWPLVIATNYQ